jgi:hypothetical protein
MTSKPKNINQLRSDKLDGITPAQFLQEDRLSSFDGGDTNTNTYTCINEKEIIPQLIALSES